MSSYRRDIGEIVLEKPLVDFKELNPSWWDGFSASVADTQMPLFEAVQEFRQFNSREFDQDFDVVAEIPDELISYYPDLIKAKDLEHYQFLENRVRKALKRDIATANAPITAQLAAGVADPLFLMSFIPFVGQIGFGANTLTAIARFGAAGAGFGLLSEARRAPFAVADREYETLENVAVSTAIGGLSGGLLKFGIDVAPAVKLSTAKTIAYIRGKPFSGNTYTPQAGKDYDSAINSWLISPVGRILQDPSVPQSVKEFGYRMLYNSTVPIQGNRSKFLGQSVAQKSSTYHGTARNFEESMRNLHMQDTKGIPKAKQMMGTFVTNPFKRGEFDDWYKDLIEKYIKSADPNTSVSNKIKENLSEPQKQAFNIIKKIFDDIDADARFVKLEGFLDDASIKLKMDETKKAIDEKAKLIDKLDASERQKLGLTKKQKKFYTKLELEQDQLKAKLDDLEFTLQSPTRKSFRYPIFYDKTLLQNKSSRKKLEDIFTDHYTKEGLQDPRASAKNTLSKIMEEDAEEMSDFRPAKGNQSRNKHMLHRKTNINEYQISDFMIKDIEVMYTYLDRMGKRIEFKRAFGDKNIDELLDDAEFDMRKSGMKEKKIAEYRAGLAGDYDRLMGSLIRNPDRLDNQLAQMAKTYSGWVYLPFAGVAAMTDHGSIMLAHGTKKYFEAGQIKLFDKAFAEMSAKNLRSSGEGLDIARAFVQRRLLGDTIKRVQPNRIEKLQQKGSQFFYTANLLGPSTVFAKQLDHILVNNHFIKLCRQYQNQTINKFDREYLARYGFDEDLIKYVNDSPTEKSSTSDFEMANTDDWATNTEIERDMKRRYQAATNQHANNTVIYGQAFDKPLFVDGVTYIRDNPFFASMRQRFPNLFKIDQRASTQNIRMIRVESGIMTIPFTFWNFTLGANTKLLGALRDPNRLYKLQGVIALMALGGLALESKERLKGRNFWGKENLTTVDKLARTIEYSGVTAFYGDLGYTAVSMAANFGLPTPIQPKYLSRDKDERLADGLTEPFGAPVGLALDYYRIMNKFYEGETEEALQDLRFATPFVGHPFIRGSVEDLMRGDSFRF